VPAAHVEFVTETAAETSQDDALERAFTEARAAIERVQDGATGTDLVPTAGAAADVKIALQGQHAEVAKTVAHVREQQAIIKAEIDRKKAELDAMRHKLEAELEPAMKYMRRLQDGIAAVNLYLGRDETIEHVQAGTPAPADTQLTVFQQVLAMDEESALIPELGGIDHKDIDRFLAWLKADPAHLDQIVPEPKSVVAMIPRRERKDYGDPWSTAAQNAKNHHTWWLLRNGQNVYLMTTDFDLGPRVTPKRDEFTRMFTDRFNGGKPLKPGSSAWLKAEEQADARTRHYMKVALILQGLIDRTAVFHPLPEGGIDLLSNGAYERGIARIVADDELQLSDGRPSFREWHKDALQRLDVGQRVVGHFSTSFSQYEQQRITPKYASGALQNVPHVITRGDARSLYFVFDRTDSVWHEGYWVGARWQSGYEAPAKTRATYMLDREPYYADAAYLPLDQVSIEDMEYYLGRRSDRHEYRTMFPALKAAIAVLREEEAAEAAFRALIAAELERQQYDGGAGSADADARTLIRWYKTSVKWFRPFVGDTETERKAMNAILREVKRRLAGPREDVADAIIAAHPDAIAVAWRTDDFIVVEPQPRRYPATAVPHDLYVTTTLYTRTGKQKARVEWQTLRRAQTSRWTMRYETDAWAAWRLDVRSVHLTDEQIDQVVEQARGILITGSVRKNWVSEGEGRGYRGHDVNQQFPVRLVRYTEFDDRPSALREKPWCSIVSASTRAARSGSPFSSPDPFETERLLQFTAGVSIRIDGDTVTAQLYDQYGGQGSDWHHGRTGPEASHERASGRLHEEHTIWENREVAAADLALAGPWWDAQERAARLRGRVRHLVAATATLWNDARLADAHARFLEDYGDESLWDDHSKSVKIPAISFQVEPLMVLLVQQDIPAAGRSIAELAAAAKWDMEIPPEVAVLRFPAEEDEDEDEDDA